MKLILIACILMLFYFKIQAEYKWQYINPRPDANHAISIHFVTSEKGYLLNNLSLLRTEDCGNTWEKWMDVQGPSEMAFYKTVGLIIGKNGYILKSYDQGNTWNKINFEFTDALLSISMICEDTFFVSSSDKIFRTNNGGFTWNEFNLNQRVVKIFFTTSKVGFAACYDGTILKTEDGGNNWSKVESVDHFPANYTEIYFVNKNIGFAYREHSDFLRTVDGGKTWSIDDNYFMSIFCIQFINQNTGFCAGEDGVLYKTKDAGENWEDLTFSFNDYNDINTMYFINEDTGFIAGYFGRIYKTVDGGKNWKSYSPFYNAVQDILSISSNIIYCSANSCLYKSVDSGKIWHKISNVDIVKMQFLNDKVGFGMCRGGILKTSDAGLNWTWLEHNLFASLNSIYFINEDTGFISASGYLLRTYDGGKTCDILLNEAFDQIQFINSKVGFMKSVNTYERRIFKTENGGDTWLEVFKIESDINSLFFVDEKNGYIVGEQGLAYSTKDGGSSWNKMNTGYYDFKTVKFYNHNIGYISGEGNYDVHILRTNDGGANWSEEDIPFIYEPSGLYALNIAPNGDVFAGGERGIIIKTQLKESNSISTQSPIDNYLSIYPNPVINKFTFKSNSKIHKIEMYSINGGLVNFCQHSNTVDISNFPQGLYILKAYTEKKIITRKIVKY